MQNASFLNELLKTNLKFIQKQYLSQICAVFEIGIVESHMNTENLIQFYKSHIYNIYIRNIAKKENTDIKESEVAPSGSTGIE